MSGTVVGEKEDNMEQMIVCAVALVALGWWASVAPWKMAVSVQWRAGVGRLRIK